MRSSSSTVIVATEPKTKYGLHAAAILFYRLCTKEAITKNFTFSKTYYQTPFQNSKLSGPSVIYTQKFVRPPQKLRITQLGRHPVT